MQRSTAPRHTHAAVLDAVLADPSATRARIGTRAGLSPATVSRAVEELVADGLLAEGPAVPMSGRGRPTARIEPGPRVGCAVGVDLGASSVRAVRADPQGVHVVRAERATPAGLDANELAVLVGEVVEETRQAAGTGRAVAGVVVGVPGRVRDGRCLARPADRLSAGSGERLVVALEGALEAPVVLENDANVALVGELREGAAAGCSDAAVLTASTEVDAGVAVGGVVLRGRTGLVGELSALPVGDRTLRDLLSVSGLVDSAAHRGVILDDLAALWARTPDPALAPLVDDASDGLVVAVTMLALAFEPEVVVLTGRLLPLMQAELTRVRAQLTASLPAVPDLRTSEFGGYAGAVGAGLLAVAATRSAVTGRAPFVEALLGSTLVAVPPNASEEAVGR